MKSGSSSSFRAAAELPDRDDDPPPVTIPAVVVPGERCAEKYGNNIAWEVCDWVQGADGLEPECRMAVVDEADARLLVFGGKLLAAAKKTLALWDEHGLGDSDDRSEPVYFALKAAIKSVEGK